MNDDFFQHLIDVVYAHGPDLLLKEDCDEILKSNQIKREDVTPGLVAKAEREARERMRTRFKEHNADPNRAFQIVLEGDRELDPSILQPSRSFGRSIPAPPPVKEKVKMKVPVSAVRALFVELGFDSAREWDMKKLQTNVDKFDVMVEKDSTVETERLQELMDLIRKAKRESEEITVVVGKEDAKKKVTKPAKPVAKDEDEEVEEEEVPTPPKKKGKKEAPKSGGKGKVGDGKKNGNGEGVKRVGVVATITSILQEASKTNPITQEEVVKRLCKKFPDRDEKGMKHTAYVQICSEKYGLAKKGLKIHSNSEGYWLAKK